MIIKEVNGYRYLGFANMEGFKELAQGFSLRQEGREVDFSSQRPEIAQRSREEFCRALGLEADRLGRTGQVHGSRIAVVGEPGSYPEIDGLITNEPGTGLLLLSADCILVLVYDPVGKVVGAAHAGWRGTVQGIAAGLVERMAGEFGCRREELVAGIGPGICRRCYEVGVEVAQAARQLREWELFLKPSTGAEKWRLDLPRANWCQLRQAGLREENIELSEQCSFEQRWFHSYRREGEKSGRAALISGIT